MELGPYLNNNYSIDETIFGGKDGDFHPQLLQVC